ncbi:small membrane protein YmiC [Scandinavium sp. V105_16]|uniref:Small membrane protein YmiC n=1 Tax=Scandinavium lactucae TaxID=3095028 RepID=A0AAJ2SBU8_9ENTR|nr:MULTISPECIES: small membrane protein YmiC [unclassified Scandinavium]MDX6022469.1 small membrane protein YmiC [Scandinavium sp. V105_16]MDX6033689.1 small membrane protein YmiC [Scandinavium sp. V105_12]MDX6042461.1 small membrane protein YmiC [Scandinavium sp. V105_6]MDX6052462.1 small membrane protein YmiC [Scandinavium sp. V105_1]
MNTNRSTKYWAWMGAFSLSVLFWCQLVLMLIK